MENFQPDDFLAGWVGGAAGVLVGHPLDTVKTRLQAGTGYNSMLHCITSIHHKETIRGFFKGMAFPLATVAMCNSVIFGVFGTALRLLSTRRDATTPCKPALFDLISASALSGVAAVAVGSPIELVKIRLQMQVQAPGRQGTFRGPLHCFLTTLQQGGLLGVYRGGGAMLLRDIPGYCTYFVPYTLLCQNLTPQGRQGPHPAIIWLSGGVSGAISWGLSTPLDVVKSRLQADGIGKTKFHGVLHCICQSYHTEGLRVFFRGTIVNCVRGFPMSAAMFLGYELSLKAIRAAQACAEL